MKAFKIILTVLFFGTGCGERKDTVLTKEETDRHIEQLRAAVYVDGYPDNNRLVEFVLTHPDRDKVCELNSMNYKGPLGKLFIIYASTDLSPEQQAEINTLMQTLASEAEAR